MKFQCESCERLIPLEAFRVDGGTLVVPCQRCGVENRVRAATATAASVAVASPTGEGLEGAESSGELPSARGGVQAPALRVIRGADPALRVPLDDASLFSPPEGHCPKCVSPRREQDVSCSACGLVYANFLPEEHSPSESLMEAWRALAARWEDWEAHDRLLNLAMGRGELAGAGRLYRVRLARAPDDALARRARDEVVRRASMVVPSGPDEASAESLSTRRLRAAAVAVLFVVVLGLVAFIIQRVRELMGSSLM
ncbi:hypothetical protein LZ198_41070 [Myxococcus sp. K15C18031901]|uniref:hypothetical protein n=1 Tax=Myxococcus dinghuensis TaxID=2906761 RepID=UPI0020A6ED0A|nr:hypothetical protein [Myxococcus dinghuensis]MCP3105280.1 hypothetical protein [Myxococcus dinghuensis]